MGSDDGAKRWRWPWARRVAAGAPAQWVLLALCAVTLLWGATRRAPGQTLPPEPPTGAAASAQAAAQSMAASMTATPAGQHNEWAMNAALNGGLIIRRDGSMTSRSARNTDAPRSHTWPKAPAAKNPPTLGQRAAPSQAGVPWDPPTKSECKDLASRSNRKTGHHLPGQSRVDELFMAAKCGWAISEFLSQLETHATTNACVTPGRWVQMHQVGNVMDLSLACQEISVWLSDKRHSSDQEGWYGKKKTTAYPFCKEYKRVRWNDDVVWEDGVAVRLAENWANHNIGHANTDMMFLSEVLRQSAAGRWPHVSKVILDDSLHLQLVNPHRMEALATLQKRYYDETGISFEILHPGIGAWPTSTPMCFPVAIQKLRQWVGGPETAQYYRQAMYDHCGVVPDPNPSLIFFEIHSGKTRQYADFEGVKAMVLRRRYALGATSDSGMLLGMSLCEQVELFSRIKLLIAVHGAAVAGNGLFLPPKAVAVEISPQYTWYDNEPWPIRLEPYLSDSGNLDWAEATGVKYVGSRSLTYEDWSLERALIAGNWRHIELPVILNQTRFEFALDRVQRLFDDMN